jgi:uncharacterized protein (TIRG00374 family)
MTTRRKIGNGIWYALAFSFASLYFIFKGLGDAGVRTDFRGVDWWLVGFGFGIQVVVWLSKAARMYFIAAGMDHRMPLVRFFQIYLATCFISHVTPFNSGGTPLQIYLLNREGISLGQATAITAVDLGLNTMMFLLLIPVALAVNLNLTGAIFPRAEGSGMTWLLAGLLAVGVMLALARSCKSWRRFTWIRKLRAFLIRKGWFKRILREWAKFSEGWLLLTKKNRGYVWGALLSTVVYWLFYLSLAPLIIWAIGRPGSFWRLIGYQLIFNFAQILVPTPGGSGGSELLLTYLFKGLTGPGKIGVFVLLWKSYTFFSSLLLGGYFFWKLLRRPRVRPG